MYAGKGKLWLNSVGSTNTYLRQLADKELLEEGFYVAANYQFHGRGQRDTYWYSSQSKNILCSVLLYPEFLDVQQQFNLSKMAALAVKDFLTTYLDSTRIHVKWPNDILVDRMKISGILIENALAGRRISSSIVGIGLNVNENDFPADIAATSMYQVTGIELPVPALMEDLVLKLKNRYSQIRYDSDALSEEYLDVLYGYKETIALKDKESGLRFEATIAGVAEDGMLELETSTGPRRYAFKEVVFL